MQVIYRYLPIIKRAIKYVNFIRVYISNKKRLFELDLVHFAGMREMKMTHLRPRLKESG